MSASNYKIKNLQPTLIIGGTLPTSPLTLQTTSANGTTGSDIIFTSGNNGNFELVRMLNNGNVGIGITLPTVALDVLGSIQASTSLILKGSSSGTATFIPVAAVGTSTITIPAKNITLDTITTSTGMTNGYIKGVNSLCTFETAIPAASISVDAAAFNNNLTTADTTVQAALTTLDTNMSPITATLIFG